MKEQGDNRYLQATALLPPKLRRLAEALPPQAQFLAEELRLRVGQPLTVVLPQREQAFADGETIQPMDLELVLEIATHASIHTAMERLRNGFFTVEGGHRIGLCGSAVVKEGMVYSLRHLSSLNIRIARQILGAAEGAADQLWEGEQFQSTLILSPPGGGKTTLLRDLIRILSDGIGHRPLRVGVADERGELAALWNGIPQLEVGRHTDVIDGCPKGIGLLMLLRGMNPQVLAADELTAPEDCTALAMAANCGVSLLCTAHAASLEQLQTRPVYQCLLETRCFQRLMVLSRDGGVRHWQVSTL